VKIGLISPKGRFLTNDSVFRKILTSTEGKVAHRDYWSGLSSGLLIIGAMTPDNIEIELIDENFDVVEFDKEYDIIAISITTTQQANRAYEIADSFRKKGIHVVIGGIHATVLPDEAKQHADTVIIGEAENTWLDFINDFSKGNGKAFYRSEKSIDLINSPVPKYELLKPENYKMVWIQATRGCPHDCEFCVASSVFGRKYRRKKTEQIENELKIVKKIWGKKAKVGFADDNMFVDKEYSRNLIDIIKPLNIKWFAQTDISIGDDIDFLRLLKNSGCELLFIGFESLSKTSLISINKTSWKAKYFDRYPALINNIQSNGIGVMGAFVLGFDSDTKSIFDQTIEFIVKNKLYAAQLTALTPLPGTRVRDRFEKEKRLLDRKWDNYTFGDVNFLPQQMTPEELQEGIIKVYKGVYDKKVRLEVAIYFKQVYLELMKK
jgi:radical SAM superfamily enzyme YgiQ (UPF0313 family)